MPEFEDDFGGWSTCRFCKFYKSLGWWSGDKRPLVTAEEIDAARADDDIGAYRLGECRRRAPVYHPLRSFEGDDIDEGHWPTTWGHDWCGEFVAKRELVFPGPDQPAEEAADG